MRPRRLLMLMLRSVALPMSIYPFRSGIATGENNFAGLDVAVSGWKGGGGQDNRSTDRAEKAAWPYPLSEDLGIRQ
jgi:hypothetical protein